MLFANLHIFTCSFLRAASINARIFKMAVSYDLFMALTVEGLRSIPLYFCPKSSDFKTFIYILIMENNSRDAPFSMKMHKFGWNWKT